MGVTIRIDSDFVGPFCFIAERSSLTRLQKELDIEVDWRGFELHPETPPGGMQLTDMFPAARVESMREHMKTFAAGFGVGELGSPTRISNTRRVLAISELAREQGKLDAFRDAAMDAYWREDMNLEDDADLRTVATRVGLAPDEALRAADDKEYLRRVDAMRAEATEMGVTGIPTFFIGDECIVGCQPYDVLAASAERAGAIRK